MLKLWRKEQGIMKRSRSTPAIEADLEEITRCGIQRNRNRSRITFPSLLSLLMWLDSAEKMLEAQILLI